MVTGDQGLGIRVAASPRISQISRFGLPIIVRLTANETDFSLRSK